MDRAVSCSVSDWLHEFTPSWLLLPKCNLKMPCKIATLIALFTICSYLHLGGDEVDTSCWSNSPEVAAWMAAHNYTADQTYEYFVLQVDAMAKQLQRSAVRWEEVRAVM